MHQYNTSDEIDLALSKFERVLTVTGHRPDKLGGYELEAFKWLVMVAKHSLKVLKPDIVITGMALGWDLAIAEACRQLDIPFIAAVPCPSQCSRWPARSQDHYHKLLNVAAFSILVSNEEYNPGLMEVRNQWMVKRAKLGVLALYNEDAKGGTANAVRYSMKQNKDIYNAWDIFSKTGKMIKQMLYPQSS